VTYYLEKLREQPHLHDKVEFAILLSSYHFGTEAQVAELTAKRVLTEPQAARLIKALRDLTIGMLTGASPYQQDLQTIRTLARRERIIRRADRVHGGFCSLLALGTRDAALPFAGLARVAFVATSIVHSLQQREVWSAEEAGALIGGANKVTSMLRHDFAKGDQETFMRRYGHLRPGTYNILSPRYDESGNEYFNWSCAGDTSPEPPQLAITPAQRREISRLLEAHHIPASPGQLLQFIQGSIAAREYAKFHYSRVVSELLTSIRGIGGRLGFDAEDMSYTNIEMLTTLIGDDAGDRQAIAESIKCGRQSHAVTEMLFGPYLLREPEEISSFTTLDVEPNFITRSRIGAKVANVDAGESPDGAIAMIEAADPGYDWIFTHNIAGLITAFGGANSHMAIRALELGLPAVIGVGEAKFRQLQSAGYLEIDASNRVVQAVSAVDHYGPAGKLARL
jgi:phosphohistidine swiveling domain-containing protein